MIHLLSLGAGVQSSTMALMASMGEILPSPNAAIFADTQDEPASVYWWLEYLRAELAFPIHVVTKGKLSDSAVAMRVSKKGLKYSKTNIPFFTLDPKTGDIGKIPARGCTRDYKLVPLIAQARKMVGPQAMRAWRAKHKAALKCIRKDSTATKAEKYEAFAECQEDALVCQWVGISLDEATRAKPSREPWAVVRWPLLERRMTRMMCLEWMKLRGFLQPPRSACVYCPFHTNHEWRRLQLEEPAEFARAVQFERDVQAAKQQSDNMTCIPFLHRSCKPLSEIDFRTDKEHGQAMLWQDECEGMCGV